MIFVVKIIIVTEDDAMCNFSQLPVIPAKAGICCFIMDAVDSCFRRNDRESRIA